MRGMGAVLAIGLVASTAPVAAQEIMTLANLDGSCGGFHTGPSPQSDELIKVTFVNNRAEKVWPAWINYAGYFDVKGDEVPAGGTYSTYTKVGHYWIMIDGADWHCIQRIPIEAGVKTYVID
ncbi:MAG: hypothetical protein KDK10_17190 [Maritimibacter sp.]|nr:hypothetical protein [Maritimibacter sp.]